MRTAMTPPDAAARPRVVWHVLDAADLGAAIAGYGDLCGWQPGDPTDLGPLGSSPSDPLSRSGRGLG